jgi:hypothetical protein
VAVWDFAALRVVPDGDELKIRLLRDEAAAGTLTFAWGQVDRHEAIPYACDGGSDND